MKKNPSIVIFILLFVLFSISACASLEIGTTEGRLPPEELYDNSTDASYNTEKATIAVTSMQSEIMKPARVEKILEELSKDPTYNAYRQSLPAIYDVDFTCFVSNEKFESLITNLGKNYTTLSELIKIVGKPHVSSTKTATTLYGWLSLEGDFYIFAPLGSLERPSEITYEEELLYYRKWYYFPSTKPNLTETVTPETTKTPETTCEPIPGTTEEYVETTVEVGDWPWP